MTRRTTAREAPVWLEWSALLAIYIIWGSTYLAIGLVVRSLPPLLAAGARFVVAGVIVALVLALWPGNNRLRFTRAEVLGALVIGCALITGGNGLVMVGQREVPSGLAALVIAAVPLWVVIYRLAFRERVRAGTLAGVIFGMAGVAILVVPGSGSQAGLGGMLLLVLASASWAAGSYASRRIRLPADPFASTALQMLAGGVALVVAGLAAGEAGAVRPEAFTPVAVASLLYLLVFGSLVAYTAYTWLLQHAPVSKVATYAYVNPVVAIALGMLVGEELTPAMIAGAGVIITAVALVVTTESRQATSVEPAADRPPAPATSEGG